MSILVHHFWWFAFDVGRKIISNAFFYDSVKRFGKFEFQGPITRIILCVLMWGCVIVHKWSMKFKFVLNIREKWMIFRLIHADLQK